MRPYTRILIALPFVFLCILVLHFPLLRLPYYWDEAGYYIPAALDFYRHGLLIPRLTLPTGHTPLVMMYLGVAWHLFCFSEITTRAAMILIAAATAVTTYALGCRVAGRETGIWAAILLALSPLFYAQSSLVFLDPTAALFTSLAVLFVLNGRWLIFAVAASLAVLSKETAVAMLAVVWAFMLFRRKERRVSAWVFSGIPIIWLAAWAIYYHSRTGFWTGNAGYLQYNLYSAFTPLHVIRSLLARVAEVFFQGFNWFIVAAAAIGIWWARKNRRSPVSPHNNSSCRLMAPTAQESKHSLPVFSPGEKAAESRVRGMGSTSHGRGWAFNGNFGDFLFLTLGLITVYILMLSVVGGAILPRYMLPVFPVFFVAAVAFIRKLPNRAARPLLLIAAACFVAAWFINPPYPFPYEDNVSYADFIHLHEQAARYLESLPGDPVILTAWPATDELKQPFLGYVSRPLRVLPVEDFRPGSFTGDARFDVAYLYSRQWEPARNLLAAFRPIRVISRRFYDYQAPVQPAVLVSRFHLKLMKAFRRRGQWVRIYAVDHEIPHVPGR